VFLFDLDLTRLLFLTLALFFGSALRLLFLFDLALDFGDDTVKAGKVGLSGSLVL
jgi:hypothetical protein